MSTYTIFAGVNGCGKTIKMKPVEVIFNELF